MLELQRCVSFRQVFSPDGHKTRVNRAWEELWGVRLERIKGYNILEDRQLEAMLRLLVDAL